MGRPNDIYAKKGNTIVVYSVKPLEGDFSLIKERQMQIIPENRQVLFAHTNNSGDRIFENPKVQKVSPYIYTAREEDVCYSDSHYHELQRYTEKEKIAYFLEQYLKDTSARKILQVEGTSGLGLGDLILMTDSYEKDSCGRYRLEGLVNVPSSLVKLQYFINGEYDRLTQDELYELLGFVKVVYSKSIDIDDIEEVDRFFNTTETQDRIQKELEKSKKVYEIARQMHK